MDEETKSEGVPVPAAEELQQHVEASLEEADGNVASLTGQEGEARSVSPESVAQQAWRVGRENPWPVAVGGALVLGTVIGRRSTR